MRTIRGLIVLTPSTDIISDMIRALDILKEIEPFPIDLCLIGFQNTPQLTYPEKIEKVINIHAQEGHYPHMAEGVAKIAKSQKATMVIFPSTYLGYQIGGLVAAALNSNYLTGVMRLQMEFSKVFATRRTCASHLLMNIPITDPISVMTCNAGKSKKDTTEFVNKQIEEFAFTSNMKTPIELFKRMGKTPVIRWKKQIQCLWQAKDVTEK